MSTRKIEKQLTLVFKALASEVRRKILDLIKDKELSTGEIADHFAGLDRCTVMQHLGVLEKADLLIVRREGRFRYNSINSEPFQLIYNRYIGEIAAPSADFLFEIKGELEGFEEN